MPSEKIYRDAVTGEWVTEEYAAANPDTTVAETVDTTAVGDPPDEPADDAGYGLIELCVAALVIIVLLFLVVHLANAPR